MGMKVRIISEREVYDLLPMAECMEVMAETLKTLARGDGVNPLRSALKFPDGNGLLGLMPAYLASPPSTGVKVVTVMPGNHGTEFDSHQGFVLLFEINHGCPLAVLEASSITAIRTAAVSGVATRLLARKDAKKLAILGSGVQARSHLEAMLNARDISEITVWSRTGANAQKFAEQQSRKHKIKIVVAETPRAAVANADIICTTTSASEPVLKGEWISAGAHINAVGACLPKCRELDTEAVLHSRLFVDRRESALNEAGDFLIPKAEGAIGDSHIVGEIGEILLGKVPARQSEEEITLFKSLGLGVEDLGAAYYIYEKAKQLGQGVEVEIGGPQI
ncbi:MAG: ornithine cyclodeaminase family protein [Calditrichaeota bacterium]|nr:MAG: ornithine cyclodeaminase family protein [Calditrichota bacterium]